jgi:hypothetical protein
MNKLYLLNQDGTFQEVPSSEYGALEYGSPTFDYMRPVLKCQTIEHLSALFAGHVVHLFFDEEGLFDKTKLPNDRASAVAGNRRLRGPRLERLRYDDLTVTPPPAIATLLATDMLIVGNAFMWTGEME